MQPIGCLSSDLFRKNFDSIWKDAQQEKVNAFNVVKFTKDYYVETLNCQYSKKGEQANFTKLQNSCIYKKKITVYEEIQGVAIKKTDSCSNPLLKKNQTIEMLSPSM